jgi:dihydrofolate reductase
VEGPIEALIAQARVAAGDKDVYVDGGDVIRQALDAGLVDELTVSIVPIVLGRGAPLFAGAKRRHPLVLVKHEVAAELVQLTYRCR